jgi:alanine-glyoxylate transaminase/serine-glyoxylate transaminase/serine-pyruvate transaminase
MPSEYLEAHLDPSFIEIIQYLLEEYEIEIASGLGDLAGEVFRIGCMGHSCRPGNVGFLLTALGEALDAQGADVDVAAMRAALAAN